MECPDGDTLKEKKMTRRSKNICYVDICMQLVIGNLDLMKAYDSKKRIAYASRLGNLYKLNMRSFTAESRIKNMHDGDWVWIHGWLDVEKQQIDVQYARKSDYKE